MPGLAVTAEALEVDHAEVVPVPLLVASFPCTVFVLILFVDFFSPLFFAAVLLAAAPTALPRCSRCLSRHRPLSRAHSIALSRDKHSRWRTVHQSGRHPRSKKQPIGDRRWDRATNQSASIRTTQKQSILCPSWSLSDRRLDPGAPPGPPPVPPGHFLL